MSNEYPKALYKALDDVLVVCDAAEEAEGAKMGYASFEEVRAKYDDELKPIVVEKKAKKEKAE